MKQKGLARVAFVINSYDVVINVGAVEGVCEGERYLIYAMGSEIKDPATGASLGRLELVRGEGSVVHVQEHMATVRTDRVKMRERVEEQVSPFRTNSFLKRPITKSKEEVRIAFENPVVGDIAKLL